MAIGAAPIVLLVLATWLLVVQDFCLVDDAYISFRYAANLAAGHGLVWNPGEYVEGYTNLLWVLLLTPFARAGLDLTFVAIFASLLASSGVLELMRRLTAHVLPGRSPWIHALPPLLLAFNPSFAYWAGSGMESALFALLSLGAIVAVGEMRGGRGKGWLVWLLLALAYFTRPEGALVAAIVLGVELLFGGGRFWQRFARLAMIGCGIALVIAGHVTCRYLYYGDVLPNTYYAKVIVGGVSLTRGLHHLGAFVLAGGLLALVGLGALRRRPDDEWRPLWLHGYALLFVYTAYLVIIGGDIPPWNRFYLPLLPVPLIASVVVIARYFDRLTASAWPRRLRWAVIAIVFVACTARNVTTAEPSAARYGVLVQRSLQWLIDEFFQPSVPAHALVAMEAVGRVGYYTPNRIIDALGLNNRYIAHQRIRANPKRFFAHDKSDWLYVLKQRPDYIAMGRGQLPEPLPGYDTCWPTHKLLLLIVYRRRDFLWPHELGLGVPPGVRRRPEPPPQCILPPKKHFPRFDKKGKPVWTLPKLD